MFKLGKTKVTDAQIKKIARDTSFQEDKVLKRINSLLSRKDLVNLDNDKMDALRMLAFHLEDNKGMSSARLVKFLKN
jgi:hypothetical protein